MRLQVAFDRSTPTRLVTEVEAALEGGADVIELGTPMLKRYGTEAVSTVRAIVPSHVELCVDTKTLDFPEVELPPVIAAGADAITMMASASNESLVAGLDIARSENVALSISTMGYPLAMMSDRARAVVELGAETLIAHGCGACLADALNEAVERAICIRNACDGVALAIGGGITRETIGALAEFAPKTLIAGRAATDAGDIATAVAALKDACRASQHDDV